MTLLFLDFYIITSRSAPRWEERLKSFIILPSDAPRTPGFPDRLLELIYVLKMDQHDDNNPGSAPSTATDRCADRFNPEDPDQQDLSRILKGFKIDGTGLISLGTDGVLRSLTGDREVLDAVGISPGLIKAFLDRMTPEFRVGFEGADGTKTPKEQWFNPDKSLLPPPLTDVQRKQSEKWREERMEAMRKQEKQE